MLTVSVTKIIIKLMEDLSIEEFVKEEKKRKPYKEFSDNDTYALRDFKIALQNKVFWRYIVQLGIPDGKDGGKEKYQVFYYVNGKNQSINNIYVFMCREKLQPSKWYYKITEKLPPKINFTPKYTFKELMEKETVGHLMLQKLQEQYTMEGLVDKYNLKFYQMKNIRYKRKSITTGKMVFKTLPPASVMMALKDEINPDYWFIFPEEIE